MIGCGEKKESDKGSDTRSAMIFWIVSGSENKEIEPIVQEFANKEGVSIRFEYQGSIDIMLMLAEQGKQMKYDAIWPANSLWISLGDEQKVVKYSESILRSPVVLGVKKSLANQLGWIDKPITVSDILHAAQSGQLRFAMTSATQSNSGACTYIGFLYAMAGRPNVLEMTHLRDPQVREKVKNLLAKADRSSASSGWLKETVVKHYDRFQAMFNYESMIIEANQELVKAGKEPLYAVYPTDGILISDSPLGYIDKGDPKKEQIFRKLQTYLLSDDIQNRILKLGRRTGLIGISVDRIDKSIFNPDWGIDVTRIISPVPTPSESVIKEALDLYQVALRKPSCTAYVVDVSGSMEGQGIQDLKTALISLFDQNIARKYMLQPSPEDIHIILPFNNMPLDGIRGQGNNPELLQQLITFVQNLRAGGGTDIYSATARALEIISKEENIHHYFPAVILMTDGKSQGSIDVLQSKINQLPMGKDIPIFSITFGDADETQLKQISEISIGRVFSGKNLIEAFRTAKGYN